MKTYQRIKEHLDKLPEKDRRICPVKEGACACTGCATGKLTIKQAHIDLYKAGKLA